MIEDHEQALALTRHTGEISQIEWQEALKPLLLAISQGQVVTIETETYIAAGQLIIYMATLERRRFFAVISGRAWLR